MVCQYPTGYLAQSLQEAFRPGFSSSPLTWVSFWEIKRRATAAPRSIHGVNRDAKAKNGKFWLPKIIPTQRLGPNSAAAQPWLRFPKNGYRADIYIRRTLEQAGYSRGSGQQRRYAASHGRTRRPTGAAALFGSKRLERCTAATMGSRGIGLPRRYQSLKRRHKPVASVYTDNRSSTHSSAHSERTDMQNLEALLQQIQAHEDGMTFEQYTAVVGPVLLGQVLFRLESCEDDAGFLLRSDDGSYHIWFIGKTTSNRYEGKRYHVTETGTWYPNQLSEAMNDLMNQMKIDCEWLIERNGERYE